MRSGVACSLLLTFLLPCQACGLTSPQAAVSGWHCHSVMGAGMRPLTWAWCCTLTLPSPAEHPVSDGRGEDQRVLPAGGVLQPSGWHVPLDPVGRPRGHEAQHCTHGLARVLEAGGQPFLVEELCRWVLRPWPLGLVVSSGLCDITPHCGLEITRTKNMCLGPVKSWPGCP
jgi:hypothetical protein